MTTPFAGAPAPLLDERQAAARLALSWRTLQRWRVDGFGPRFVRLGSAVRYRADDLDAFVAAGLRTSTTEAA